ncbi:unnamed protein product [Coregonus sp. 'balchen']|nr:unnamed protein product [Coregonus sp. 'balchen']
MGELWGEDYLNFMGELGGEGFLNFMGELGGEGYLNFMGELGGEGYLNFMGNEFGHPEWLDFPRIGNCESYKYARRQYNLLDPDNNLRYTQLRQGTGQLEEVFRLSDVQTVLMTTVDEKDKVIVFERANVMFVFNFHPSNSYSDYRIAAGPNGKYPLLLGDAGTSFLPALGYPGVEEHRGALYYRETIVLPHQLIGPALGDMLPCQWGYVALSVGICCPGSGDMLPWQWGYVALAVGICCPGSGDMLPWQWGYVAHV